VASASAPKKKRRAEADAEADQRHHSDLLQNQSPQLLGLGAKGRDAAEADATRV
jgi:hypothetical protein